MQKIEQSNTYTKPESTFTLLIYFRNGYTQGMKFHSHKQEKRKFGGQLITDHRYALNRLVWLVEEKFKGTYKTAIIYHNPSGKDIMQYAYDTLKHKERVQWKYATTGDVFYEHNADAYKDIQRAKVAHDDAVKYKV